ncbi:MAG: hypothetical protein JNK74_16465 [Candidatus Hydrogenedentes bacterium]|nr:hypothetical protein [Candidatus Hydrogenedentota bacterium]
MTDNEIQTAFAEGMRIGVQRALAEHKRMGRSIVVERDGQIVEIPPEDIVVADEFLSPPLHQAL